MSGGLDVVSQSALNIGRGEGRWTGPLLTIWTGRWNGRCTHVLDWKLGGEGRQAVRAMCREIQVDTSYHIPAFHEAMLLAWFSCICGWYL